MKHLLLALIAVLTANLSLAAVPDKGLGMNLTHHRYYSASIPFVDVFKKTRPWWPNSGTVNLTEDGWVASLEPGQTATAMVFNDLNGHYPGGVYNIFYEGEGTISVGGDASLLSSETGHITANVVTSSKGIRIKLESTNPENPIRNIRVIIPGYENSYETQPFYPPFVDLIKQFKVVRFMDWMQTNDSNVTTWSDRTRADYATQDMPAGVAAEWIIDLANTAKVNPWITLPHKADDDYVRRLAELYRDRLDPDLKVYLEYSNEVWNGQFDQHSYAQNAAAAIGDTSNSAFLTYYSHRSVQVFDIWTDVFGGTDRVVRVMAGQGANAFTGKKALSYNDAYKKSDAYAIAPYMNLGGDYDKSTTDPTYLLGVLNERLESYNRVKLNDTLDMANTFNVPVISYEGGQHVFGKTTSGESRCPAVNRHDGMEELYIKYLNMWNELTGNNLFTHFNEVSTPSQWGCWGMLEWLEQPATEAPKYRAILQILGETTEPEPASPPSAPTGFMFGN